VIMEKYTAMNMNADGGDIEKHRLYWRCRRGMLELDILLQTFLQQDYDSLTQQEQESFKCLLNTPDNLLLEYLMGRTAAADPNLRHVIQKIRSAVAH
jgi:antitoxin CptB